MQNPNPIQVGIGTSQNNFSQTAGNEAIQTALQQINGKNPDLVILFADPKYDQQSIINSIKQHTPSPIIGCSTAGEIAPQGPIEQSVVVTAIAAPQLSFSLGLGEALSDHPVKAAEQAAQMALNQNQKPDMSKTFLFFSDGLTSNQIAVLQGLQNILGENFEIVGATAADRTDFQTTHLYYQDKVYTNSIVGVLISGDIVTATGVRTGWQSVGNSLKCTKSEKQTVYELDNQPALDIYSLYLDKERSQKLPLISFEYPFGIINQIQHLNTQDLQIPLRACLGINKENKSLKFGTNIPEGSLLTITAASRQELIHQAQSAAQQAKDLLTGARPLLILNFSSLGRKLALSQRSQEEHTVIKGTLGVNVPIAGFYTYGEFGSIDRSNPDYQSSTFHNLSNTIWVLATNIF